VISASLLLIACASCTKPAEPPVTERSLPAAPAFAAHPVNTADMRVGESCWVAYDRKRSGETRNASIVRRYNEWYAGVRKSYSVAR
jgi:hypothetical protein